ncbi:MAG: DsrE family protein [Candidatus Rokubacteria bacterium]|nr:DsrE family protein [Candidatus Rokubacteria bacterium]
MRGLTAGIVAGVLALTAGAAAADHVKDGKKVHKLVLHVLSDDARSWNIALNIINNVMSELGKDNVNIKLVAQSTGIYPFRKGQAAAPATPPKPGDKPSVTERLKSLKAFAGGTVEYTVCSNSMRDLKVGKDEIVDFADNIYPSVIKIVELVEQGYVYIRP